MFAKTLRCVGWKLVAVLLSIAPGIAAEPVMNLRLKNGSFGTGQLVSSSVPGRIGWQNKGFEGPFEFDVHSLRSITRLVEKTDEQSVQEYRDAPPSRESPPSVEKTDQLSDGVNNRLQTIEFSDRCQLTGQLVSLDDNWLTMESESLGTVKVERQQCHSLVGSDDQGDLIYAGVHDDSVWQRLGADSDWSVEAGSLVTTKSGVAVCGNVGLSERCEIKLSLSWTGEPAFVIALGTIVVRKSDSIEKKVAVAKLEVWDKQLVLVREDNGNADIAMLANLSDDKTEIDLTIYFDHSSGRISIFDPYGRELGTVQGSNRIAINQIVKNSWSAVCLNNLGKSLALNRFEVRQWDGTLPHSHSTKDPVVLDYSRATTVGSIVRFDSEQRTLLIKLASGEEATWPLDRLRRGSIQPMTPQAEPTDTESAKTNDQAFEITFMDGTRLQGHWKESANERLCFAARGFSDDLTFEPAAILTVLGTTSHYMPEATEQKTGTLKIDDSQYLGHLLPTSPEGSHTALHWQPQGSLSACEISQAAQGAIVYFVPVEKSVAKEESKPAAVVARPAGVIGALFNIIGGGAPNSPPQRPAKRLKLKPAVPFLEEIQFRSGDVVRGDVLRVEERGVSFTSLQTKTDFATHDQIEHVKLQPTPALSDITPEKLARLMIVPRSMKNDPPTHLLVSVTGDYLRGRLIKLDGETITIEVRSEIKELPAAQIAQIVWLHKRDWDQGKPAQEQAAEPDETVKQAATETAFQVHGIVTGDQGLTLRPERMVDGVLQGSSELLGESALQISELQQLLFGREVGDQVRKLHNDPWSLSLAVYPRVYREDAAGDGVTPMQTHELIGKAAPEFTLKSIAGDSFRLQDHHDRVVVLDFWASWCGPCIQTMPLVDQVVLEIGADKVCLAAVNIQETAPRVRMAIKRLAINMDVLLDEDGQTAAAYNATAIPQTVIIDRNGKVTHVFVGGGQKFVEQFRDALKVVIANAEQP